MVRFERLIFEKKWRLSLLSSSSGPFAHKGKSFMTRLLGLLQHYVPNSEFAQLWNLIRQKSFVRPIKNWSCDGRKEGNKNLSVFFGQAVHTSMWPLSYHTFVPRLLQFCRQLSSKFALFWLVVHLNIKFRAARKSCRGTFKYSSTNIFFHIYLRSSEYTTPWEQLQDVRCVPPQNRTSESVFRSRCLKIAMVQWTPKNAFAD